MQAQLNVFKVHEETGLSLRELAGMDLSEYARLVHGRTPTEAALAALDRQQDASAPPPAPQQAPPAHTAQPQGIDPTSRTGRPGTDDSNATGDTSGIDRHLNAHMRALW